MALEALFKESRYPSQGVIEEFAKLNNLDGATVKVWFNNKRQRGTGEQNTTENRPSDASHIVSLIVSLIVSWIK